MDLYGSRLKEMKDIGGDYSEMEAAKDYHRYLMGTSTDHVVELTYYDKRRVHNLKYFTWIEQQGKMLTELNDQWVNFPEYWKRIHDQVSEIDRLIDQFNERTGLLKSLA
jgi:hypothetical protein